MLSDYFRVNLPYGMVKKNGRWMLFNRENLPIGFHEEEPLVNNEYLPIYGLFAGLSDQMIMELTGGVTSDIERDQRGNICRFWLYNDATNPMNQPSQENEHWAAYWKKLEVLARLRLYPS